MNPSYPHDNGGRVHAPTIPAWLQHMTCSASSKQTQHVCRASQPLSIPSRTQLWGMYTHNTTHRASRKIRFDTHTQHRSRLPIVQTVTQQRTEPGPTLVQAHTLPQTHAGQQWLSSPASEQKSHCHHSAPGMLYPTTLSACMSVCTVKTIRWPVWTAQAENGSGRADMSALPISNCD